ncbi:transcriptional regulator [Haloechinothrix salitolerans]|uniref:Multiprotein-bridging factor 1 family protein n=1 Tax=Haloechinothrix salitolerans TaxID=926830 RepID=A0ABW2BZE2_9PSEU
MEVAYIQEYQDISDLIKGARCALKLSKAALARQLQARAGTTAVTGKIISRWERGIRVPGPYWRSHLAPELGITRERLDHAARMTRRNRRQSPEHSQ